LEGRPTPNPSHEGRGGDSSKDEFQGSFS
jgi:hypothetical protein